MGEPQIEPDYDAIVVGGGLAGLTAARDLGRQGYLVLLLEARDRLGGRTWYRRFADTDQFVEFGGTWIAQRWQLHLAAEIERYGLPIAYSPTPQNVVSLVAGRQIFGLLPVPVEELIAFERALYEIIHASHRLDANAPLLDPPASLDIPFSEFLAPLDLPPATYDFIVAQSIGMFGCEPSQISTISVLSWVAAYDHSAIAVYLGEDDVLERGTVSLVDAQAGDSGATIRTETPVTRVTQTGDLVTVTMASGETLTARTAVIAVPLNVLDTIEFHPPLHPSKRAAAREGHAGHSTKIWALVRNAPRYLLGMGRGPGIVWLGTQRELAEGSLMVGFGWGPNVLDVHDREAIQRNVAAFAPGAEVIATDAHDWSADPYSRGAWLGYRPGQITRYGRRLREPEGRLAFAGSDIAIRWAGWMEGAVGSGKQAARYAAEVLAADRSRRGEISPA